MRCCLSADKLGRKTKPSRRNLVRAAGNYSQWLEARAQRLKQEGKEQSALQRTIDAELEFVRSQAQGQQKKGKARLRRYDELLEQVRCPSGSDRQWGSGLGF